MSLEHLETKAFKILMQEHISNTIEYMFDNNQEFSVACDVSQVYFTPELSSELQASLPEITLFMLANYSFESANLKDNSLSFEAGFGAENFGALVEIPLLAIKQMYVEEYPILINISSIEEGEEIEEAEVDSMSALLSNPENAKLLKKNR